MNADQPTFDELISLARERADGSLSRIALEGYASRSQAVAVQTRWIGAIRGMAEIVDALMPAPRFDGLRHKGPDSLDPVTAGALRYAMAMRSVGAQCGRRPTFDRATRSPLESGVEAARLAIGAAHDIVVGATIPVDDAQRLMALTAPLTHVLAHPRLILRQSSTMLRATRAMPNMDAADDAASALAALFTDGTAAAVGRALALPSHTIRTDSLAHEWTDRCSAIAGYVRDQRARDAIVSVRVALLVARAQLITCTVARDTFAMGQWLSVTQGLSGRSSVLGLDPELAAHHFRLHQIVETASGTTTEYADLVAAMPAARVHLDRATSDLGHIVARDHIDQWVPGKTQRRYLPQLASPAFMPQRTTAALPPLPLSPAGALHGPQS